MRRITTGLAIGLLAAGLLAGTASATTKVVVEKDAVATLLFANLEDCLADYGFTYTGEYVRTRTTTLYYNGDQLIREVRQIHFNGTETNDSDPSRSLTVNGERRIVFDFVHETITETGTLRHVTARGQGIVLHDAGSVTFDLNTDAILDIDGPHQLLLGDTDEFCAALAG
jgi:hypothetical protein